MADVTALERARLTVRGVRAELILEDGHLTLSKDGPPATSLTVAVDQVRGTVLDPGSRGGRGWIHVAVVGGTLAPPGELAAMSDPYTIPLTSRSAVTARRLARFVERHLHERGLPSEPTFAASTLERGRFSSGVALTPAPGAARTVVDRRSDDAGPSPSPAPAPSSAPGPSPEPSAPPPLAPPTSVVGRDLATELRQLGELHDSGVLTDAEFEQAKARVLR